MSNFGNATLKLLHLDGNTSLGQPEGERENFLPLHTKDLIDYLALHPQLPMDQRLDFVELSKLIPALLHHRYRQRFETTTHLYAPLDPDRDRLLRSVPVGKERDRLAEELFDDLAQTLEDANYHKLSPQDIQNALNASSKWGVRMRVGFRSLRRLEVYGRGLAIGKRNFRNWKSFFRLEQLEVPLYQRLVVVFRVHENAQSSEHDPQRVYLRMFKNVPQQDIDMMLPATGVQMTWLDHSRIVVPSLYAIAITFWRFVRNVMLLAFFGVFKSLALLVFALFAIGYGLKSMFTSRFATQQKYMLSMTQSLYYQNLDNNLGVLLRLLEEGEQQEAGEAILAYFVAALVFQGRPIDLDTLDLECERILREACGIEVDFDVHRTARTLAELGVLRLDLDGWRAVEMRHALAELNGNWDARFQQQ
ncbi:MAG: DUF3754 domain-containing protein [Planctomycetota bacterium]